MIRTLSQLTNEEQEYYSYLNKNIYHSNVLFLDSRKELYEFMPKNGVCCEIGVCDGKNAISMLEKSSPSKLHLVDIWEERFANQYVSFRDKILNKKQTIFSRGFISEVKTFFRYRNARKNVMEMFSNDDRVEINFGFSEEISKSFPDLYFDWIYIDANHAFEHCWNDLTSFERTIKKGGYICGHDYDECEKTGGVVVAVNKFCEERQWELIYITKEGVNQKTSFALRKIQCNI